MLIEAWERLRGYNKWTMTVATVRSSTLSQINIGIDKSKPPLTVGWESICTISWQDKNHIEHTADFPAYEESPLYQLCEENTVNIRYNPANPSDYYLPELIQSRLMRIWKLTLYILMLAILGIAFLIFLFVH